MRRGHSLIEVLVVLLLLGLLTMMITAGGPLMSQRRDDPLAASLQRAVRISRTVSTQHAVGQTVQLISAHPDGIVVVDTVLRPLPHSGIE